MSPNVVVGLIRFGGSLRALVWSLGGRLLSPILGGILALGLLGQAGCSLFTWRIIRDCTPVSAPHLTAPLDASTNLFFGQRPITSGSSVRVNALEAATGTIRWQQDLGPNVSGQPTVYNHVVYVVGQQSDSTPDLFAYRAADGTLLWHTSSPSPDSHLFWDPQHAPLDAPLVADGLIYTTLTASQDGLRTAALHANTGTLAWSVSSWSFPIQHVIAIDHLVPLAASHGLLVVSTSVNTLQGEQTHTVVLRAKDGQPLWETPLASFSALVATDAVYLHTLQGLYALRATNGKLLWTLPWTQTLSPVGGDRTRWSLSSVGQQLYMPVYETTAGGNGQSLLYALNTRDGSVLWKSDKGASNDGTPVEVNGAVYVVSGAFLFALQAQDGHLLWRLQANSATFGTPLVLDQVVFVQSHFHFSAYGGSCPTGSSLYEAVSAANATTGALYWRSAANPWALDPVGDVPPA